MIWCDPPENLFLNQNSVHIWRAELEIEEEKVRELETILSEDEKARGDRFHFPKHRQRFIVGRGTLRIILGRYCHIAPEKLKFEYSDRGKPKLADRNGVKNLQFNLSHSEKFALYGFTLDKKIGIDLEYLRPMPDAEKIAKRFFSTKEYGVISALSPGERQKEFFRVWTAKEAYLKGTGDGLAGSLDRVEVSLSGEAVGLVGSDDWFLYNFVPAADYTATVAVEGKMNLKEGVEFWKFN